jgi:hypothetical protein
MSNPITREDRELVREVTKRLRRALDESPLKQRSKYDVRPCPGGGWQVTHNEVPVTDHLPSKGEAKEMATEMTELLSVIESLQESLSHITSRLLAKNKIN